MPHRRDNRFPTFDDPFEPPPVPGPTPTPDPDPSGGFERITLGSDIEDQLGLFGDRNIADRFRRVVGSFAGRPKFSQFLGFGDAPGGEFTFNLGNVQEFLDEGFFNNDARQRLFERFLAGPPPPPQPDPGPGPGPGPGGGPGGGGTGGGGGGAGGTGGGAGGGTQPAGGGGTAPAPDQGPFPTTRDPQLDPRTFDPELGAPPAQGVQVGQDPLSLAISQGLQALIGSGGAGQTEFAQTAQDAIRQLLERGGQLDPDVLNQRLETVQEALDRQRSSQVSNLGALLGERGLVSLPGAPQGVERTGLENIERDIASQFAGAFRDIVSQEQAAANQRFGQGAGLASGLAQGQTQNLLSALGQGTERQLGLTDAALEQLRQSTSFNQFLAQFGLDRELALEDLITQRGAGLAALINILRGLSGQASQGFIGQE